MAFTEKLAFALRAYPPGDRYLVGVSGGRDSVALLHGLTAAGYRRLVVCHLDHGIRGASARADARFVQRLADRLGLPAIIERTDVPARAKQAKLSLETAARDARRRFFARVARLRRCGTVFLAHQADDQVETFLFNLLRGAGATGLAGMAVESRWVVGRREVRWVRPLLSVWRAEIDEYLVAGGWKWRDDPTNADPAHATRNRLRAEVLPLLEQTMGREVKPALWRTADLLGAEEAWLSQLTADAAVQDKHLPTKALVDEPVARQRRLILAWLRGQGATGIGYREVESVRALQDTAHGPAKVNLPGNRHVRRKQGHLFVEVSGAGVPPDADSPLPQTVPPTGKNIPKAKKRVSAAARTNPITASTRHQRARCGR